jgi:hypothetical protein
MFGTDSIHGDLADGMLRHFFAGTLGYVGLAVHRPYLAYHVPYVDDARHRGRADQPSRAISPNRPALKSSTAWPISAFVFITNGP